MIALGTIVRRGSDDYKVVAVGHPGERYYWLVLVSDETVVAMVPATELEPSDPMI